MNTERTTAGSSYWLPVTAVLYFLTSISLPFHLRVLPYVIRKGTLPIGHAFGQTFHQMDGPIMQAGGPNAIIASILAFGVLSAFDLLAGYWLWKRQRRGATLALILLPVYWFFAIGWGVPYMLLIGALKAIALAFGWKSAR